MSFSQPVKRPRPAAYLRCYPADPTEMSSHRHALRQWAAELRLDAPRFYLDNGCRSCSRRPQLESLIEEVALGNHDVVLIPGPWVFALDPALAWALSDALTARGCQILDLPPRPRGAHRPPALPRPRPTLSREGSNSR